MASSADSTNGIAIIGALMALVAGCGGSKERIETEPKPEAPAAEQPVASACERDTAALVNWIDRLLEEGAFPSIMPAYNVTLVEVAPTEQVKRLPRAPVVVIERDAISVNGRLVADALEIEKAPGQPIPELRSRLQAELRRRCLPEAREALTGTAVAVIIQVDERVPWAVVRSVTETVYGAGYDGANFALFETSRLEPPATSPELQAGIDGFDPSMPVESLQIDPARPDRDHPAKPVFERCPALKRWAADLVGRDLAGKADAYREVPAIVGQCDCAARPDEVRAILWWWAGRRMNFALLGGALVPLAADGAQRTPIRVADDLPWSKAHREVVDSLTAGADAFALVSADDGAPPASRAPFSCPK